MSDIPVLNGVRGPEPVEYVPQRKQVLVITNDSTVFLTDRWVSAYEMFGGRVTEVKNLVERLSEHAQVSFGIISGQYGFVPANYVVMRYSNVPSCREEFLDFDPAVPTGLQLYGHDPQTMAAAAVKALDINPSISFIDVNLCCPAKKVVRKGEGSALIAEKSISEVFSPECIAWSCNW